MKSKNYQFFEGEMTIQQFIKDFCPCLPESTIRNHIKAGRMSAKIMLEFTPNKAVSGKYGRKCSPFKSKVAFGTGTARYRFKPKS